MIVSTEIVSVMKMFDTIIISGGASRGYMSLGCLFRYEDDVKNVKRYIGCSVGSILCILHLCGYDVPTIMRYSLTVSCHLPTLDQSDKDAPNMIDAVRTFMEKLGILDENPYIRVVNKLIKKKFGFIPTMKELRDLTGKDLTVVASCLSTYEPVYISAETFPDMLCTVAIDISSRIPILFTPILYGGLLYVDGGLCDHFPISLARTGEKTLAIYTCGKTFGTVPNLSSIPIVRFFWILVNTATKGKYSKVTSTDDVTVHIVRGKGGTINTTPSDALLMFLCGLLSKKTLSSDRTE